MKRTFVLLAAAALTVVPPPAHTQTARPTTPLDPATVLGRRDGRVAGELPSVGGYVVAGVATGFLAGFVSYPVGAHNNSTIAGASAFIPLVWTVVVAARRSRAVPLPDLATRIQTEPVAYQDAFRASYAGRLAQRRRRAAIVGGVVGAVAGFAVVVGLAFAAISSAGT